MSLDDFLKFLDDFWELFGPIPEKPIQANKFTNMKL
jgi:hypothetical protein